MADAIGRGNLRRARKLSNTLLQFGVALGGSLGLVYIGCQLFDADALPRLFTQEPVILHKVGREGGREG